MPLSNLTLTGSFFMNFKISSLDSFHFLGIPFEVSEESNFLEQIKTYCNKPECQDKSKVYRLYNYNEKNHAKNYAIGCKVEEKPEVAEEMIYKHVSNSRYLIFKAGPDPLEVVVKDTWSFINDYFSHQNKFKRSFTNDFEVYSNISEETENVMVKVYIAIQ